MKEAAGPRPARAIDQAAMVRAFDRAAVGYDRVAVLQRRAAEILLERLDALRAAPVRILDAGSGTGHGARLLARRYRRARILHLDLSLPMLQEARRQGPRWFSRHRYLCASMTAIPLAAGSVQLAFSNMALHWCIPPGPALAELHRVLDAEGLLLFSCCGPDTLRELRASWPGPPEQVPVHDFPDMHDVGDAVVQAGFSEPVLETDRFVLHYASVVEALRELRALGARNVLQGRRRGLGGRRRYAELRRRYERRRQADGRIPATFELVFGHAWRGAHPDGAPVEAVFPIERLRLRRRDADR